MNNLIGISGKIGSGKDATGIIIDMISEGFSVKSIVSFVERGQFNGYHFQHKKFADEIKDIACLLIGCTREQLEDREFKEKELGEEWWYYDLYKEHFPYINTKAENPDSWHERVKDRVVKLTPRKLLQLLGTEAGRDIIHPNIWVNALFTDYKLSKPLGLEGHDWSEGNLPNWIITDVRFPNEAQAIKDRGGIVIRVNRPQLIDRDFEHESETALDDYEFDYVIENEGSIEELVEKVKQLNLV